MSSGGKSAQRTSQIVLQLYFWRPSPRTLMRNCILVTALYLASVTKSCIVPRFQILPQSNGVIFVENQLQYAALSICHHRNWRGWDATAMIHYAATSTQWKSTWGLWSALLLYEKDPRIYEARYIRSYNLLHLHACKCNIHSGHKEIVGWFRSRTSGVQRFN